MGVIVAALPVIAGCQRLRWLNAVVAAVLRLGIKFVG